MYVKQAANWGTQDVLRELNDRNTTIADFPVGADVLGALLARIVAGEITVKSGREVFAVLLEDAEMGARLEPARIERIIGEKGLAMVSDTGALEAVVDAVIARNAKAVAAFRGGKEGAVGPLIGQVMRDVKGADAKAVRQLLIEKLRS